MDDQVIGALLFVIVYLALRAIERSEVRRVRRQCDELQQGALREQYRAEKIWLKCERMRDAWRLTDPEGYEKWRKGCTPDFFFWPRCIVNVPVDGAQQEGG